MTAPSHVRDLLEIAATQVFAVEDERFFIGDVPMEAVDLYTSTLIRLRKTGGTTGHQEQVTNYIHYELQIPALKINYSIYITPSADNPTSNQKALARAIRWFIPHYNGGSMFNREESAI